MLKEREMKWMAGILGAGILFVFLTMVYKDQLTNSRVGYQIADSIFQGRFREFYNSTSWSYGPPIYLIYALWSIPVWLIGFIGGFEVNLEAVPVILWYKVMLAVFAIWSIYLVGKLAEQLYAEKKREIQLQYAASFLFIFPVFAIAQCDIIGLCFVLLALYYYMKEQNVHFLIAIAVAITMKYFALLVFLPLLLFRFRKIGRFIATLAVGMFLLVLNTLVVQRSDAVVASSDNPEYYVNEHIRRLAEVKIDIGAYKEIGLLGFFFLALCIVAYVLPNRDTEKNKQYSIWLAFSAYLCFFLFYGCNFYWYILLAPFLVLLAYTKPGLTKICLLLETLYGGTVALDCMNKQHWVFLGPETFSYLLIGKEILENRLFAKIYFLLETYLPLVLGVSYAAVIGILILTAPGIKDIPVEDGIEKEIRIVTWLRIGVIFAWIILALLGTVNF